MQIIELHHLDYDEGYTNGTSTIVDATFRNIQKSSTTFLIWRIENMAVVPLPKDQYGTFYASDSYIIYTASQKGLPTGTDTVNREIRSGPLEYHIHFWLGSSTTPDKSGAAAYKTVELDGHLGGIATQHRETQGNESARFKSYFKKGLKILKGGTETAFKSIREEFEPKLFKIKGRRTPITTEEEEISWNVFNSGDVFIILTPKIIFIWIGRAANGIEKLHAAKIALTLKSEHNIPNITFVDDGYEKTLAVEDKNEFNKYLPLEKRVVYPPNHGASDEENDIHNQTNLRLYQCSDNSGKYRVTEIKTGPIKQADLNSEDVYIIDNAARGIWVWVGKKASKKERTEALRNARGFIKKKNYPNNTKVTRIIDGSEPTEFQILFLNWTQKNEIKINGKNSVSKNGKIAVSKMDALTLHDRPLLAAESQLVDDGSGTAQIWKFNQSNITEVPVNKHGIFYSGHCYLVLYSYDKPSLNYIIYYWLGVEAPEQEIALTIKKVAEINHELEGNTVQVRIVQANEPPHFLQIFDGKMTIFNGKTYQHEDTEKNTNYLLQIFGSSSFSTKAVQVPIRASSLNSNYCYVLRKHKNYFIWCGCYSTGDQREMAKKFVGKDFEILMEGKESSDFWKYLNGVESYITSKALDEIKDLRLPLLFQCSTTQGQYKMEEILNFTQNDLIPEDIMLLDATNILFIWIGDFSTREERKLTIEMATNYLKNDPAGRNINTPIVEIKQGYEPPNFTGFFPTWDNSLWIKTHKSFDDFRTEIEGTNSNNNLKERTVLISEDENFDQYDKYPINILKGANEDLPNQVDALKKEMHLTHDDFVTLFKINYLEFKVLPKWKQQEMKKKVGLF